MHFLEMIDEDGRRIASGAGPAFLEALHAADGRPVVTPMTSYSASGSTVHGHRPAPLLKSCVSPEAAADSVIAAAQSRFGRAAVLRRLDELGVTK